VKSPADLGKAIAGQLEKKGGARRAAAKSAPSARSKSPKARATAAARSKKPARAAKTQQKVGKAARRKK
jgi:hypothetical protein